MRSSEPTSSIRTIDRLTPRLLELLNLVQRHLDRVGVRLLDVRNRRRRPDVVPAARTSLGSDVRIDIGRHRARIKPRRQRARL